MYEAEIKAVRSRMRELADETQRANAEHASGALSKRGFGRRLDAAEAEMAELTAQLKQLEGKRDQGNRALDLVLPRGCEVGDDGIVRRSVGGTKGIIGQAPSLAIPEDGLRGLHDAMMSHKSFRLELDTKAPSTIGASNAIPSFGGFIAMAHESQRVLDLIPTRETGSPVEEYLQHSSTTGTATKVAAGAQKPSVTLNVTRELATVRKIAVVATANDEDLSDFRAFGQYVTQELTRLVIDEENSQVLSGNGTDPNLTGLLTVSGLQTIDAATAGPSAGVLDGVDAIEEAITKLRTGPAYATASAIVMHPSTWSLIRRTKDSQGRFIVNPDPTTADAMSLWGVKVVVTTSIPTGDALVMDGAKFGEAIVRNGLVVQADFGQTGFEYNQTSFRCEERLAVFSPYPAAGCLVSNITS